MKRSNPTFKDVRAYCEQYQDTRAAISSMPSTIESTAIFNSLKTKSTKAHATAGRFKQVTQSTPHNVTYSDKSYGNCASCGKRHSRFTCRFRYASCHKCGKTGHIQSVCRSTKACRLIQSRDSEVSDMDKHFSSLSLAITFHSGHIRKQLFSSTGNSLHFILDAGSVESPISVHDLKLFAPDAKLQPSTVTINGITGHSLPVVGSCEISISDEHSKSVTCTFIGPSILGLKAMQALNVNISLLTSIDTENESKDLIIKCSKASGGMKIPPVRLPVNGDPVFLKRRVISYGLREPVMNALNNLCIVKMSFSAWGTPIVTPLKSDGKTPRICGDYRITLNPRLLKRTCTTIEPEDILNKLTGSKIFSEIDLKDAYLQIPLDEISSTLTTINIPFGLYRYKFQPFGLSVSPAIFQQVMNYVTI
ncbi:unnamed protein product, partial [Echinostoma caproni]|uniref:CCHC-type domain-containing protein n=1 Tax=Echinostoma caproni TaxID=27848 RepID=A0A183A9M7_9TREM